jgi:hypothetical protein
MIRKKDEEKILLDLKKIIKNLLESGFKNRKGRQIDSVEYVQIINIKIDENNDNRDIIVIQNVEAQARVWVLFNADSRSSDDILLRNQKSIIFSYDREIDNYKIHGEDVLFFDNTTS